MTINDPWATPAEEPQTAPPPAPAPVQQEPAQPEPPVVGAVTVPVRPVIEGLATEGKITLTFKGAGGYGDRWLVAHVANPVEGLELLNDPKFKELLDLSKRIAAYDGRESATPAAAQAAPQQQSPSAPPAAAQQAPGGETRQCSHGQMQFKSGFSQKSGKAWSAWFCPTPKNTPGQCEAIFLR